MQNKPDDKCAHCDTDHQKGPEAIEFRVRGYKPKDQAWEPTYTTVVKAISEDEAKEAAAHELRKNNEDPGTYDLYAKPADKSGEKEIKADMSGGWELLKDSVRLLLHRPLLLIPLFFAWISYASFVLWNYFYFKPENFSEYLYVFFPLLLLVCFIISMANIIMLTLLHQIEENRKTSFPEALYEAFVKDSLKVFPISLLWAVIWMILLILESLVSSADRDGKARKEPSLRNAAVVLSGADTPFSLSKLGLSLLEKVVRMTVFLSLPAIAWENKGPLSSLRKSFEIIKKHPLTFFSAYGVTLGAFFIMVIPLAPITIAVRADIALPSVVWLCVIIYSGIIFILNIYLEQMVTGLLYLWHLKWKAEAGEGPICRVRKPELSRFIHEFDQMAALEKPD